MGSIGSVVKSPEQLLHLSDCSRSDVVAKASAFLCIVGIFVGACVYSSSALAELEDNASGEVVNIDDDISAPAREIHTSDFIDRMISEDASKYASNVLHDDTVYTYRSIEKRFGGRAALISPTTSSEFDELFTPNTVRSLDGSAGVHLDRITNGLDADRYVVMGKRFEVLLVDNRTDGGSNLPISSPKLQATSCGEGAAECNNLDLCGNEVIKVDKNSENTVIWRDNSNAAKYYLAAFNPTTSTSPQRIFARGVIFPKWQRMALIICGLRRE